MNEELRQFMHQRPAYRTIAALAVLTLAAGELPALEQRIGFRRITMREFEESDYFRGGALVRNEGSEPTLMAWGSRLHAIKIPKGRSRTFDKIVGLGPGGCPADINGDGMPDLVVNEQGTDEKLGRMLWLEAPEWQPRIIDTESRFEECLPTLMFGKPGVLVIHRNAQVRFYETPPSPAAGDAANWPYRDVYSIYTPSAQGGLLRGDVDGDGRQDIFAGNYWVQSPAAEQQPWHIFAINKWWEEPRSAILRLALIKPPDAALPVLVAAEAEAAPARVSLFEPPPDQRQLWRESQLEAVPPIRRPAALTTADLNGDGRPDVVLGENAGDGSRLLIYWDIGGGKYQGTRIDLTAGLIGVWAHDYDGDGDMDLIGLGPRAVSVWRNQRLK